MNNDNKEEKKLKLIMMMIMLMVKKMMMIIIIIIIIILFNFKNMYIIYRNTVVIITVSMTISQILSLQLRCDQ